MLKHSLRELSHLICCSETTGSFSLFLSLFGHMSTQQSHSDAQQNKPRWPRRPLCSIPFKSWSNLLAVKTQVTPQLEQIALICSAWSSTGAKISFVNMDDMISYPYVLLYLHHAARVCGVLHLGNVFIGPKWGISPPRCPKLSYNAFCYCRRCHDAAPQCKAQTFNQHLICSLLIMSLIIDWASVRWNLMLMISCASVECRQVKGGGDILLRLKTLPCIWMQAGGDSEWNASHYQLMLAMFLLTELFKCVVGIKFWHCNRAAWRRRSRGICVELPLKLIQTVLGNCCYWGGTFLEARRERANFLNVVS